MAFKLHPVQRQAVSMLGSAATDVGLGGGSRSGKTFVSCYAIATRALAVPNSRHVILRFRQNAVIRSVVRDTWPKMMNLAYPGVFSEKDLNKTDWFWKAENGSEVWFAGLDDKDRVENILGNEYSTMYYNESSQIPWFSVKTSLSRLAQRVPIPGKPGQFLRLKAYYDFNPPSKRHWTYLYFIEKKQPDDGKPLANPQNIGFLFMNPEDNAENLDEAYLERLRNMPERERRRFYLGQFSDEDNDSLWTEELYDAIRVTDDSKLPDMVRIIVAVDPSGCADDNPDTKSDEIGIVVVGLGTDGHGYLLQDLSGKYGPGTWGKIVGDAFKNWNADCVVGESNFGGAMVKYTVEAANDSGEQIPIKLVQATRGKVVRAEPISALYERGKIHHVGYFQKLEEQGCSFYPHGYQGMKSPDRKDAAIWGVTELFPGLTKQDDRRIWVPPQVVVNHNQASAYRNAGTPGLPSRQGRP